jgi:hypothetical protein
MQPFELGQRWFMFKRTLLLFVVVLVTFSIARAQTVSLQEGYTVVTPQGGNVAAFLASASLFNTTDVGTAGIDVGPAPILTAAALSVRIGGAQNSDTALVFVNPSRNAATLTLALFNTLGTPIGNQTISVAGGDQISTFVNSFFQNSTLVSTALLRISSNIPIAILALDFSGVGFTAVPITNVAAATSAPGQVAVSCPTPIIGVSCPIPVACPIGVTCPIPSPPPIGIVVGPPSTISVPVTGTVTGNGTGSFVFPEVAPRGAFGASVTVGNLTTTTQVVRFDFFNSSGDLIRSITNIPIAPQGFVTFSSAADAIILSGE